MTDLAARAALAAVWLHQGLWRKLLGRDRRQADVLSGVPVLGGRRAAAVLGIIGVVEVGLAAWILSGRGRAAAATAQTALLAGMNAGGVLWGRSSIADPAGMVVQNLALVVLAWRVAGAAGRR